MFEATDAALFFICLIGIICGFFGGLYVGRSQGFQKGIRYARTKVEEGKDLNDVITILFDQRGKP